MDKSTFVYVTYIRTTPEKLWSALTQTNNPREFFFASTMTSELEAGGNWRQNAPDGTLLDDGEVVEIEAPTRLVLNWRNHYKPEMREEGDTRMTYQLEPAGESVKLTVIHEIDRGQSKFIEGVSRGWPIILSSLKSLLETGEPLAETKEW